MAITITIAEAIGKYVDKIQASQNERFTRLYPSLPHPYIGMNHGKRYTKIVKSDAKGRPGSAYCFVEIETGNIYKAASWSKPAPGVRGNIYHDSQPLLADEFYSNKSTR